MRPSFGWRTTAVWSLTFIITIGSMLLLVISGESGAAPIVSLQTPTSVDAGEMFLVRIDPQGYDIVLEAKYPGARTTWIFEPDEKKDTGWEFKLPAPYSGTNLTLRAIVWGKNDGENGFDAVSDLTEIELTGWTDDDGDGLSDAWEELWGLNTDDPNEDEDDDGIILLEEMYHLTDPGSTDTDDDSMDDAWEISRGSIPFRDDTNEDPDRDGWSNFQELVKETDPRDPSEHPEEPPVTPWYWVVMIFAVLLLILGYFVKQLFSKKRLDDDLEDFDRGTKRSRTTRMRDNSGKI